MKKKNQKIVQAADELTNASFKKHIVKIVLAPIILIFLLLVYLQFQKNYLLEYNSKLERFDEINFNTLLFEKDFSDMEASLRGFVLTGQKTFHISYRNTLDSMDTTQESVFRLIGPNHLLGKKFREVLNDFILWRKLSSDAINIRSFNNKIVGVDLVKRMNFKYGELRDEIEDFRSALKKEKKKAKKNLDRNKTFTRVFEVFYLSALLVLLVMFISKEVRKLILSYRKILNKNIENVEKMEKASRAKDLFLANMSHEIRTPLGAIIGFADQAYLDESLNYQTQSYISFVRRNSRHLLSLVDDLFDVSKINANKVTVTNEQFDFYALLEDVKNTFLSRLNDKKVTLNVIMSDDVPQFINSDITRFKQIISNLVGNAVKFSIPNTQIEMIASFNENILTLDIIDQGVGIAHEVQADIFKTFTQEDVTHSRKYGGAGLGLAISRKLAKLMKGNIELISSEKNKGSHFRFTIELKEFGSQINQEYSEKLKNSEMTDLEEDKIYDFSGKKFLLAEDAKENQILFKIFLESSKAQVQIVDNGTDAVREALNNDFDIVILDIQMPGLDGYEALDIIRKADYKKPILALTAHTLRGEKEKSIKAGFNDFISKPVAKNTLLRTISNYL